MSVLRLLHRDLRRLPADASSPDDLQFELLTPQDVASLSNLPEMEMPACMASRLDQRFKYCFAAKSKSEVVAYYWLAIHEIEAEHNRSGPPTLGVAMRFPDDYVFGYKAFVHPKYRGSGLYTQLVNAACHWAYHTLGSRHLISTVDWTNHAAQRSCRRQQLTPIGSLVRLGWLGRYITCAPRKAAKHGIVFPETASVNSQDAEVKPLLQSRLVGRRGMKHQRALKLVDLRPNRLSFLRIFSFLSVRQQLALGLLSWFAG
ncbi:MAG: GNAT family N-acetyltransferase [Pirellulaceae bacterium]